LKEIKEVQGEETIQNENGYVKKRLNQDSDEEKDDHEGIKQRVTMERTANQEERISYQSQSEVEV